MNNEIRITYITTSYPYGKGESFLENEVNTLLECGMQVTIVPLWARGNIQFNRFEITVEERLFSKEIVLSAFSQLVNQPLRCCAAFMSIFKSRTIKVFIKNIIIFPKALWLASYCLNHGINHIHAHWVSTTSTMAMIASKISGVPWSFTAHRWDIADNNLLQEKLNSALFCRFISNSGIEMARQYCQSRIESNMVVIHMGVDIPELSQVYNVPRDGIILCPANLLPVKGHHYLIQAIAILAKWGHNYNYWFAGEGPMRQDLQQEIERNSLENIRLLGHISHSELIKLYKKAIVTCVVLPSISLGQGQHEGIPVALMEAMSYGVPVIGTDTGGVKELLYNDAGMIVAEKDSEALARGIMQIMESECFRKRLGSRGRYRVMTEFSRRSNGVRLSKLIISHSPSGLG